MTTGATESEQERTDTGSERWYLNDERDFLLRSIDDAERERDAGDLSEGDYQVLVARDRARLAEVEVKLATLGPELQPEPEAASPDGARPHPTGQRPRPTGRRPHPTPRPGAATGRGAASVSSSPACSLWSGR